MAVGRARSHGFRRSPTAFVVSFAAALAAAGCAGAVVDDVSPPIFDAGTRDAFLVTEAGPILRDGDVARDAEGDASSASDASAPACVVTSCDPRNNAGCPVEVEMVCRPTSTGAECAVLTGSGAVDSPCMSSEDCGPGLACFRHGMVGICGRVCCAAAPDCPTPERCVPDRTLWDGSISAWGECVAPRACDVLRPRDACDAGDGCYIVSSSGETDCRPAGTAVEGADCVQPNDCAPGLFCGGLGHRTCARICAIPQGGGAACPMMTVCRAYTYSPAGTGICS